MEAGSKKYGKWQSPCPNGTASGTGTAILANATYHGEARDGRTIGKGRLELSDGKAHECKFGGWGIDCPDVDLDVRADRLESSPGGGQTEGEAAAVGTAENPSMDPSAEDGPDSRTARSDGARDTASAEHGHPVQTTEPAASSDRSLSAGGEARSHSMESGPCACKPRPRAASWSSNDIEAILSRTV